MTVTGKLALFAVLAAPFLPGGLMAARTAGVQSNEPAPSVQSETRKKCPPLIDVEAVLGRASNLMAQARYQDGAALLEPLSGNDCDARISLLLAAAYEGEGVVTKATEVLQRAHSVWPANNSIAISLAREYLAGGQKDKALKALAHFHVTVHTPQQEMEMAVLVYLTARQLVSAQAVAAAAYKSYPSLRTLLLLANTLQLQGRYPDVNRILEDKRAMYSNSPEFLITLAESEFDAGVYSAARDHLKHAILLDPRSYQAHYLLGNVLAMQKDPDRAVSEYRRAIDLSPDQPRTYFQLALVLRSKQDEAGEEQALNQALAADDHYAPAQCELGRILLEKDLLADAVPHLTTAIQYNPRSEEAYFLLAKAYSKLGEKDKSDEMVKRLVIVRKENRPSAESKSGKLPALSPANDEEK